MGKPALSITLLGGFAVARDEAVVPPGSWRLRKGADLVKLLALAPGHRLHREQVMDALWPDKDPAAASNNLYQALHAARNADLVGDQTVRLPVDRGQRLTGGVCARQNASPWSGSNQYVRNCTPCLAAAARSARWAWATSSAITPGTSCRSMNSGMPPVSLVRPNDRRQKPHADRPHRPDRDRTAARPGRVSALRRFVPSRAFDRQIRKLNRLPD